jgi:hypothetical protein
MIPLLIGTWLFIKKNLYAKLLFKFVVLFKLLIVYSLTYSMLEHPYKYNIAKHFTSLSNTIILLISLSRANIILLRFLFRHFTVVFKHKYNICECMLN